MIPPLLTDAGLCERRSVNSGLSELSFRSPVCVRASGCGVQLLGATGGAGNKCDSFICLLDQSFFFQTQESDLYSLQHP